MTDEDLKPLGFISRKNPRKDAWGEMKLFLRFQIEVALSPPRSCPPYPPLPSFHIVLPRSLYSQLSVPLLYLPLKREPLCLESHEKQCAPLIFCRVRIRVCAFVPPSDRRR